MTDTSAGEQLGRLERQLSAQRAALAASPPSEPVPDGVLALLAAEPVAIDVARLRPDEFPRLVAARRSIEEMIGELTIRQGRLAGRLVAVRTATGPASTVHLFESVG